MPLRSWQRWVVAVAAAKIAAAILAYLVPGLGDAAPPAPFPPAVFIVLMLCFSSVGVFLLTGGPQDARATTLGVVLLLTAVPLSNAPLSLFARLSPDLTALLVDLRPEAFLPYFLWSFAGLFPGAHALFWQKRLVATATRVALVVGALLFSSAIAGSLLEQSNVFADAARAMSSRQLTGYYWLILFSLALPVFPLLAIKARIGPQDERRRAVVFVSGLVLGAAPIMIVVVAEALSPSLHAYLSVPAHRLTVGLVLYGFLLLVPIVTAYSVVVHRVFDVRVAIRRALQYALARSFVAGLAFVPALALVYVLYSRRTESISELFRGTGPKILLVLAFGGALTLRVRQAALTRIDRLFFREQFDAREILTKLVTTCQQAVEPGELARFVQDQVTRALHLESIAVCVLAPLSGQFIASGGRARALSATSGLVNLLKGQPHVVDVRLDDPRSPFRQLPPDDQEWLADGGVRLLAPMPASDGTLVGLIALGDKKSELPFSQEDHLLIHALTVAAAPRFEMFVAQSRAQSQSFAVQVMEETSEAALECPECGLVYDWATATCAGCGGLLIEAAVPAVLSGKFRVERRLGSGAMGVVYAATDMDIGRRVAIKTLPRVSPAQAFALRREAKALGAVTHPNLITMFGAESWRGRPMLIFELLTGGTLATKLQSGPMAIGEAMDLGIALAGALDRIHHVGVLHRDIKPSNIGFESWGLPKLLDFGLADIVGSTDWAAEEDTMVGTPAYLPPEAVDGAPPDVRTDLWQLSMVVFESVTGSNPLKRDTIGDTLRAVRHESLPGARSLRPDCPDEFAGFLAEALHRDPRQRPRTAAAMRGRLEQLKATA